MKYLIFTFFLCPIFIYGQNVSKCDSVFIYEHFLLYNKESHTFEDIDEPFIEEYWLSNQESAAKYYFKAAFLKSIPIAQRVILISYLERLKKMNAHQWMYNHLETRRDSINYFRILDSDYGIPYSDLKISKDIMMLYCNECNYR